MLNTIYNEECLKRMKKIKSKSIDMILCDLPYGVTAQNKWDVSYDYIGEVCVHNLLHESLDWNGISKDRKKIDGLIK